MTGDAGTATRHHEVVVVGGGNAGISLAARLLRDGVADVAVVESQRVHRYRPLLNYVGGGEARMRDLERPASEVMPDGCTWIHDEVVSVDPDTATVRTASGEVLTGSTLVLCPGLEEDWTATPGLRAAYDEGWAGSTFVVDSAAHLWPRLRSVERGTVVFTVPPEPAPCGATALKPLFMACDHWRRQGVLGDLRVRLVLPGRSVIGWDRPDARLETLFEQYAVDVLREARVTGLDAGARSVSVDTPDGSQVLDGVTFAHVVPHYRAPRWIADSGLAGSSESGLVDVDPGTMQHRRHPSVWALGDVAALDTRPSGGALRRQVEILSHNVRADTAAAMRSYDGYTVMPVTTGRRRLMLVEVDRRGRPTPSVPVVDLTKPRRSTWFVDRYVLPRIYFHRILRGRT